jgi:catechol 2,3-dioxygenase-like lactoylglutathione lyase family enzyme
VPRLVSVESITCSCCGEVPETGFVTLFSQREIAICYWCLDGLEAQRRREEHGHTGGWHVVADEPIFQVADVARALEHYTKLGFEVSAHDDTYAFAEREGRVTIHLTHGADDGDALGPSAVYLHVDDAGALAREWRTAGLVVEGPEDQDYGKAEGSHLDPDGNLIRFGSPLRG